MTSVQPLPVNPSSSSALVPIPEKTRMKKAFILICCTLFSLGLNLALFASQRTLLKEVFSGKRITIGASADSPVERVAQDLLNPPQVTKQGILGQEQGVDLVLEAERERQVTETTSSTPEKMITVTQENPLIPLYKISSATPKVNEEICRRLCEAFGYSTKNETIESFARKKKQADDFFDSNTDEHSGHLIGTSLKQCTCCLATQRGRVRRPPDVGLAPRFELEYRITQKVEELIEMGKIDIRQPVFICSFGSGNLLEELIIHACLSKLGICIHWVLVDSFYFEGGVIKKDSAPLGDFCSYVSAISEKQKAPKPEVFVVRSREDFIEESKRINYIQGSMVNLDNSELLKNLQARTTNPFVWISVDVDSRFEANRLNWFMGDTNLGKDDLKVIMLGSLRVDWEFRDSFGVFRSNLSDESTEFKKSTTLSVSERL